MVTPRVALGIVFALATVAGDAGAQPAEKKDAKPPGKVDVGPAIQKLKSGDEGQIRAGLDEVRLAGPAGASAAPAVAEALGKGLTLPLTQSAIETLGDLEAEAGSAALSHYTVHRNVKVRRAAVKAIARTKGAPAVPALKRSLGDADAVVRGTAASGLGTLKAKDAVPDLFVALDHRVNEAASSIGQLCTPEQCNDLVKKLGKLPLDVLTSGLDQIIFRTDVPDDAKIKVIGPIGELGTQEANKFLKDVQKRWPAKGSARVKQAIDEAVKKTTGSSPGGATKEGGK